MKRNYEQPMMFLEEFVINRAVSACNVEKDTTWTFDCMRGPNVDMVTGAVNSTIATGCTKQIGYVPGYSAARNYNTDAGCSDNNEGKYVTSAWTKESSYTQVIYTGNGVTIDGLLYASGSKSSVNTNHWKAETNGGINMWVHEDQDDGQHVMVAPVINVTSVNASW